ncbi:MAG TPA: hypothetical protein VIU86_17970, partial [Gaiellaceae bacterium]
AGWWYTCQPNTGITRDANGNLVKSDSCVAWEKAQQAITTAEKETQELLNKLSTIVAERAAMPQHDKVATIELARAANAHLRSVR